MAVCSSTACTTTTIFSSHNLKKITNLRNENGQCFFNVRRSNLQRFATTTINKPSKMVDLIVRKATPEVAGDVLSSLSLPGGFGDHNEWLAGAAGLLVTVPLMVQRLLSLTKEVDMAAQTVEKIADAVGKVAEEVDKAAEDIAEALPEGGLKKMVSFVEDLAEETAKDAQKVEDLMDKVEELDDKLEDFLNKNFKGSGKA